jgi:hypothetical protein
MKKRVYIESLHDDDDESLGDYEIELPVIENPLNVPAVESMLGGE